MERHLLEYQKLMVSYTSSVEYSHSAKIQYKELQLLLSYTCMYSEYGNEKMSEQKSKSTVSLRYYTSMSQVWLQPSVYDYMQGYAWLKY